MSNICFFCKKEFDEHDQNDIDNCIDKFKSQIIWKGEEET
jgi:hypothetical protein